MTTSKTTSYSILGVKPSATVDQVKIAFRKLAKQHHPDLNPGTDDKKMSEILAAYEDVMFGTTAVDPRVAFACEVLTLQQLRRTHDVRTVQVLYHDQGNRLEQHPEVENGTDLSRVVTYPLVVRKDDSVSDMKHSLQTLYGTDWGLDLNRTDRYGLASGWEVVQDGEPLNILGNHFFLDGYGIEHGDWLYAVIRR